MGILIYRLPPLQQEYTAVLFTIQCIICSELIPLTDLVGKFTNIYRAGVIVSYYERSLQKPAMEERDFRSVRRLCLRSIKLQNIQITRNAITPHDKPFIFYTVSEIRHNIIHNVIHYRRTHKIWFEWLRITIRTNIGIALS